VQVDLPGHAHYNAPMRIQILAFALLSTGALAQSPLQRLNPACPAVEGTFANCTDVVGQVYGAALPQQVRIALHEKRVTFNVLDARVAPEFSHPLGMDLGTSQESEIGVITLGCEDQELVLLEGSQEFYQEYHYSRTDSGALRITSTYFRDSKPLNTAEAVCSTRLPD
jgi:hypothetical protein